MRLGRAMSEKSVARAVAKDAAETAEVAATLARMQADAAGLEEEIESLQLRSPRTPSPVRRRVEGDKIRFTGFINTCL